MHQNIIVNIGFQILSTQPCQQGTCTRFCTVYLGHVTPRDIDDDLWHWLSQSLCLEPVAVHSHSWLYCQTKVINFNIHWLGKIKQFLEIKAEKQITMLNVACTASKSRSLLRDHRRLPFHHQMHLLSQPRLSVCLHSLYHSHCHVACIKSSNTEDIKILHCILMSMKFQRVHNAWYVFQEIPTKQSSTLTQSI